ncbi:Phosphopantetheine adenylyltransferase [Streptococcus sp. DD10]|uniref:pantetheine-phosphate adenylyltransferase n=1 Tax=Streptococcus sp. DD10 TaxID=1777878 RepID=UPI0007914964|nr:pantetheine-phosphate adenylyltransferase [Streptococcus sp. DD10]KXT74187.1 Phosphopantetheine adenylyltransferase [Streptococcus sp. DD10]
MSDKIGLFSGSFDPITKGHENLIRRASRLFDHLYVGVFYNADKAGYFKIESRVRMVEEALADLPSVTVITSSQELAVTVAKKYGVTSFVRGLRNSQDLIYEASMDFFNHELASEIDTIYLLSPPNLQYISSSRIRELLLFGEDISPYVPQSVINQIGKD